jgi:hypothetical protein
MRKSNWIVMVVAVAISAFLLWLWYYLGFNNIDSPLDLIISIVWWALVALFVYLIVRSEAKRQRQIRTIYVSDGALFNPERGLVACPDPATRIDAMQEILSNLSYGFHMEDMPAEDDFDCSYVVRTDDFKEREADEGNATEDGRTSQATSVSATTPAASGATDQADDVTWKGSVVHVDHANGNKESSFDGRQQLGAALA